MPVFVNGVVDDELVEFLFHARFIWTVECELRKSGLINATVH